MPYVRTVKPKSDATAVQVVYLSRDIEHLGSAHDEAELEALKAAAEWVAAGQLEFDVLRRVLLPRSHVDVKPSCPTTWAARPSIDLDQL